MTTQVLNRAVHEKVGKAKAILILEQPFFASIVCNLPISEDASIPTFATNGDWIKYNPDFAETLTMDEIKFVLCHEVGHCMFQHMFRRGERNGRGWNMAGDYVINELLINEKVGSMPQGGLHNPTLVLAGGNTTEGVYDLLPQSDKDGSKDGVGGVGDPLDDCQDNGGTQAERAEGEARMKVTLAQAAQAAKMCGKLSADLDRLVGRALKSKVDWKDVLRRFVSARAKVDYTYARPKRRFLSQDMYLASLSGEAMGEIAIAVDCSGSITPNEIAAFATEIEAIVQDTRPAAVNILYFTSEVENVTRFEQGEEIVIEAPFTGGTAFSPIFRAVDEHQIRPVCMVVLTDLCCGDFGPMPDYPTLWVTTMPGTAPWGEIVDMYPHKSA